MLIGVTSRLLPGLPWDAFFEFFDAPLPALAIPGFIGGVLFSMVLAVAGRHRRFEELSLPRFAAWGALGGILLSLVPDALVALGLATLSGTGPGQWELAAVLVGPLTVMCALSASGSLLLARKGEHQARLAGGDGDVPARLGGGT